MPLESLESIFTRRDGMTLDEARERVQEMRDEVAEGADPEEVLHDVGLEPDYLWELL